MKSGRLIAPKFKIAETQNEPAPPTSVPSNSLPGADSAPSYRCSLTKIGRLLVNQSS